jgi:hypothetical protein
METLLEEAATTNTYKMEAPCVGNSPVQLHKDHLRGVVESWYNLSMALKADPTADKAFGWILDMYAFSIASAQTEGGPIQYEIHRELMAQPPFDPYLTIEVSPRPPPHGPECKSYRDIQ